MSSLAPLTVFLRSLSTRTAEIELSLAQIARIIDDSLLPSAYEYAAWWTNDPAHPQANAWLNAGWQVTCVDLKRKTVNFGRMSGKFEN
jgi:hypothetical protein